MIATTALAKRRIDEGRRAARLLDRDRDLHPGLTAASRRQIKFSVPNCVRDMCLGETKVTKGNFCTFCSLPPSQSCLK